MNKSKWFFAIILIILCSVISPLAMARWNDAEISLSKSYALKFNNPYAASIWRAASTPWYMIRDFPDYKADRLLIEDKGTKLQMRIGSFLHLDTNRKVEKRPLMIFLPGIFSNIANATSLMHGYFFYQKGYNVLMLPNPWSLNWIIDNYTTPMGDINHETDVTKKLIAAFKQKTPYTTVSIYGYSYGAFMGARLAATSKEALESVLLVGPPIDMSASMYRLDMLADESYSQVENLRSLKWNGAPYLRIASQDDLTPDILAHAQGIAVYGGFVENLAQSVITYGHRLNITFEPADLDPKARRAWLRSFRFKDYVTKFLPNFKELVSHDNGSLIKWVEDASKKTENIRVLTAIDDFINDPTLIEPHTMDPRFLILPRGGHVGYMNSKWYWNLMESLYGKETPPVKFPVIN